MGFLSKLNRDKLKYSIKYTFTLQFVIKDCSYTVLIYRYVNNMFFYEPTFKPKMAKQPARIATKSDITTMHFMYRIQIYVSPENLIHPTDLMDLTFR